MLLLIIIPQDFKDEPLISLFQDRIMNLEKYHGLTEVQREKIVKEILKDPNKFINSDGGQALHNDFTKLKKGEWSPRKTAAFQLRL